MPSEKAPPEEHETPSISGSRAFLVMRYLLHGFGGGGFSVPDNGGVVGIVEGDSLGHIQRKTRRLVRYALQADTAPFTVASSSPAWA